MKNALRKAAHAAYTRVVRPLTPATGYVTLGPARVFALHALDRFVRRSWLPEELVLLGNAAHVDAERPASDLYEDALIDGLTRYVRPGDTVVIVGGGWGATVVAAARAAGEGGRVVVFEGSPEYARRVTRTAALNGVADRVTLVVSIVAKAVDVWGDASAVAVTHARDLPRCDVLELDCEGAEMDILEGLTFRPRVILVETHGMNGAPTEAVAARLGEMGYAIHQNTIAETNLADDCLRLDVRVLHATDARVAVAA